jgi:pyruvate dehydrogenase (quinone)
MFSQYEAHSADMTACSHSNRVREGNEMAKRVADLLVDVLSGAGVQRVYGVSGNSLNGITDSIRTRSGMDWIHVRHEEAATFAAGAEAHLTGKLAVCAGSCGPGNIDLINGLYDCQRGRVPVLAIAEQIPNDSRILSTSA